MEKLKQIVFKLANSNPNNPLTPSQIEKGLFDTFTSLNIPTHPTYSNMILVAIKQLNEEGTLTTEEMISERIIETNEGLPWAHRRCLKHHLDKLCEIRELSCDSDGSYNVYDETRPKRRLRKRLLRRFWNSVEDEVVVEETMQDLNDASEELGRGKRKRKRRRSFVFDDDEEEEEEDGNEGVKRGNVNVEAQHNEVLLLESGEAECKRNDSEEAENVVKLLPVERVDGNGTEVEKSVLKGTELNPCNNQLMIVPYVGEKSNSSVAEEIVPLSESRKTVIVCGLSYEKPETPKKKRRTRRMSISTPEKPKAFGSSGQRSPETKIPFMEDEETLKEVFQKCGIRKKHGMQAVMFKDASTLASSKAGNQLHEELPSLETSVKIGPTVEKESALTKGTEKQVPIISKSTISCQSDFVDVKHQEKQTQLSCGTQCALDGGSESIVEGPIVQRLEEPSKPKEATDGFITPSLLVELHKQEVGTSEPTGSQIIVEGPKVQCLKEPSKPKELVTPSLLTEFYQQEVRPSEPTGHCGSDNQQRELIIKSIGVGSSFEQLREDNEGKDQHEVRNEVLELPVATFANADIQVSDQYSHEQIKDDSEKQNQDDQEKLTEVTPEDEALNEQLENSPLPKRKPGRPPKSNRLAVQNAANSSDSSSLHRHKQEGTVPATIQPSEQNNKSLKQDGQVRTRNQIATMKDLGNPRWPDLVSGSRLQQQNKQPKNDGQGRQKKEKEPPTRSRGRPKKEDTNNLQSQHHEVKAKRGRPRIQKNSDEDDFGSQNRQQKNSVKAPSLGKVLAAPSELQCPEQGNAKSASHVVPEGSSTQNLADLKESIQAASDHFSCPNSSLSAVGIFDASTCLADQSNLQDKDRNQRRRWSTRNSEAALLSSDHHFMAKESLDSENEVHGKPIDKEQTDFPLDAKIPQQDCLPPSKPVTRLSNSKHDDQAQRPETHDHDQTCEKLDNQLKTPKEVTAKGVVVPLSSKGQLRSSKRQSQDSY